MFCQWQLLSGIKVTHPQQRFNLFGSPQSQREPSSRDQPQTLIPMTERTETHDTPNNEVMTGDQAELHANDMQNTTTRSGRMVKLTDKMGESLEQRGQGIVSYKAGTYDDSMKPTMTPCTRTITFYRMLWTTRLHFSHKLMPTPCTSTKQCKLPTEKSL
jgi:hypothetical protein